MADVETYEDTTTIRLRVLGAREGAATVQSDSELGAGAFEVAISPDVHARLGRLQWPEIDAEILLLRRASDDVAIGGRIESFEEVENLSPEETIQRWREWFRATGGDEWDKIADIDAELGRGEP